MSSGTATRAVWVGAVAVSLGLSAWCWWQEDVINNDGMRYVAAARRLAAGEPAEAVRTYRWPFYPALMAAVGYLAHVELETAAHLLNAACTAILVLTFIGTVRLLWQNSRGGRIGKIPERTILLLAAATVLLFPALNEYRAYVIREHGFLAFYLVGLWGLLRFQLTGGWWWALAWGGAMVLATLFRVEGSVFLVLGPCAVLLGGPRPWKWRLVDFVRLHAVLLAAVAAGWVWWSFFAAPGHVAIVEESRVYEPWRLAGEVLRSFREEIPRRIGIIGPALFEDARSYAPAMMIFGLVAIVVTESIKTVHPLFGAAAVHGWWSARQRARGRVTTAERSGRGLSLHGTCLYFALINVLCLGALVLVEFNQTGRRALALGVTSLLFVPSSLSLLYQGWRDQRRSPASDGCSLARRWAFPLFVAALLFSAGDGLLSFGPTKAHLRDAGQWIREHVPHEATLFTNEMAVVYYAGRDTEYGRRSGYRRTWEDTLAALRESGGKKYDVITIRVRRKRPAREAELRAVLPMEPTKRFVSPRGDKVLIFRGR